MSSTSRDSLSPLSSQTTDKIFDLPDGRTTLNERPLVQLLSIREASLALPNRVRVIFSDGTHFMQGIFNPRLAESLWPLLDTQAHPESIPKNAIVALEEVYWHAANIPGIYTQRILMIEAFHFVEDRTLYGLASLMDGSEVFLTGLC
ncbi:hypothetical protein FB45DRAFT_1007475 [Roridomyces roridus]|uniref:Uncharacterized protein n=1 Tax=Roridomyces roridus TaxID=1738132 RepID=A0AAD7FGL3_9AGAR|nr:hypothetical protein FB45DRAFT_1007475 [Roridomyces roridus]